MLLESLWNINWWILPVAVIVEFIVGMLWYGPLFGKRWMKEASIDMQNTEEQTKMGPALIVSSILCAVITAYIMSVILQMISVDSAIESILVAVLLWLGFTATRMWNHSSYEGKSVTFFFIISMHDLVVFLILGTIISIF